MAKTPNFLWAQRKGELFVTIECDAESDAEIRLAPQAIELTLGSGAQKHEVSVPLFAEIDIEKSRYLRARGFSLYLIKKEESSWPSLLPKGEKRAFVKVDWSRWVDSDDEDGMGAGLPDNFNFGDFDFSKFAAMNQAAGGDAAGEDFPEQEEEEGGCGADCADECCRENGHAAEEAK